MVRCLLVLAFGAAAVLANEAADRLTEAATVFGEVMRTPDRSIPQDLLQRAECVIVIPGMKKGAFVVGASFGRGFLSCRKGRAGWTAPAGVRAEGGSFGFQIGGSETDVIMLVLNKRGAEKLMSSKFTLGGDASVAAGPVGRTSSGETDALMHAQILSWSRSRGVFAGVALKGATLRSDKEANRQLYGKELTTRAVVQGNTAAPQSAAGFISLLNKYSSRK